MEIGYAGKAVENESIEMSHLAALLGVQIRISNGALSMETNLRKIELLSRQREDENWRFRCSVYDCRPRDCQSYPHLHKKDFVFRMNQALYQLFRLSDRLRGA